MPTHLLFSPQNPNSIVECIGRSRENARTMRNQIATEMWEVLNRFHLDVQRPGRRRRRVGEGAESASRFCMSVVEFSQLLQGITDSTMPREEGWYFLQAGKFLERAEWTARVLDVNYRLLVGDDAEGGDRQALASAASDVQPWATLLRSLSAYESYHRIVEPGHPAERRDRAADAVGRAAALDPVLDRRGRAARCATSPRRRRATTAPSRCPAPRSRATPAARSADCMPSSPTSGSTTCSTRACTDRCSRCSAAAIASASTSRTSSSPTSR